MAGLVEKRRGPQAPRPNRVEPEAYALEHPTHGQRRVALSASGSVAPSMGRSVGDVTGVVLYGGLWRALVGAAFEAESSARLPPKSLGPIDWHNDLSRLILDIDEATRREAGRRAARARRSPCARTSWVARRRYSGEAVRR